MKMKENQNFDPLSGQVSQLQNREEDTSVRQAKPGTLAIKSSIKLCEAPSQKNLYIFELARPIWWFMRLGWSVIADQPTWPLWHWVISILNSGPLLSLTQRQKYSKQKKINCKRIQRLFQNLIFDICKFLGPTSENGHIGVRDWDFQL